MVYVFLLGFETSSTNFKSFIFFNNPFTKFKNLQKLRICENYKFTTFVIFQKVIKISFCEVFPLKFKLHSYSILIIKINHYIKNKSKDSKKWELSVTLKMHQMVMKLWLITNMSIRKYQSILMLLKKSTQVEEILPLSNIPTYHHSQRVITIWHNLREHMYLQ